jgi:predicted porin
MLLCAGSAHAQTSVNMYGVVDLAVRRSNHQGATGDDSLTTMTSGGIAPTRLGWNIAEDLGGGLRALANIEHRFQADSGIVDPPGTVFFQQSWLGIDSISLGRMTLGRQYNVLFDASSSTFASFKTIGPFLNSYKPEMALALGARNDNQVKYALNLGCFSFEAQWSPQDSGPFSTTSGRSWGGMAKYAAGPFGAAGAYLERKDDAGRKAKAYVLGGAYQSGPLYLNASVARNDFDDGLNTALLLVGSGVDNAVAGSRPGQLPTRVKERILWTLGGTYSFTPAVTLGAQYWRMAQSFHTPGAADGKGDFYALLADYALSKRTDAYAGVEYTSLEDMQLTNQPATPAAPNGEISRTAFMVGIRHRF